MPVLWMRKHRRELLTGLILLAALALRLASLDSFLTIDEQLWAMRAQRFQRALQTKYLADTYQSHHPGVVTLWLGAASIVLGIVGDGSLAGIALGARWLVALANWAGLVLTCLLINRLFGRSVTWVAALLIGLDPFYLALSRLFHLDALLTTFTMLSLLALTLHLRSSASEVRWLLLSSLCTALALLTKSPGLLLLPFGALLILVWSLWQRRRSLPFWGLLCWISAIALVCFVLWPALWQDPVGPLSQVWNGLRGQGLAPHENENFFLGRPTPDPGPLFYPIAWLLRTTPAILLGLSLLLIALFRPPFGVKSQEHRMVYGAFLLFVLVYTLLLTLGAKKFDRYLLPVSPVIGLLAAVGLARFARAQAGSRRPVAAVGLILVQLALTLPHAPYYLSYYNPIVGGAWTASRALLVGWGEGMDSAAAYLNAKEDAADLRVTAWYQPPLAPFLQGEASVFSDADYATDYFIFYINELQRDPSRAQQYCLPQGPEKVIHTKGIDYAWICSADRARQPLVGFLEEHLHPEDVVLLSRPAPRLELRLPEATTSTEGDPFDQLERLGVTSGTLWYVHEPYENRPLTLLDQQVGARSRRLNEFRLPLVSIRLHQLPSQSAFGPIQLDPPQDVEFGQELRLIRAGVASTRMDFRQQVGVTLEWLSPQDIRRDLKMAWRVRDAQGRSWGEIDRLILDDEGRRTSRWEGGTQHLTRHLVPILPGLPPGPYSLDLTLYPETSTEQLSYRTTSDTWQPKPYGLTALDVAPCPIPPRFGELEIPESLDEQLADGLILLGFTPWLESAGAGEDLQIELFWEAEGQGRRNWLLELQLQNAADQVASSATAAIISGTDYPVSHWPAGERIRGRYDLLIPAASDPGEYDVLVGLVGENAASSSGSDLLQLGKVVVQGRAHQFNPPEPQYRQESFLGSEVALLGYDLSSTQLSPGDELAVIIYWQARGEMSTSYTVFVHLLDQEEAIWGQRDTPPGGGLWPTASWVEGEVLSDRYAFQVPADVPSGEYQLEIGMYEPVSGKRRPVTDTLGESALGDRILLDHPITIRR